MDNVASVIGLKAGLADNGMVLDKDIRMATISVSLPEHMKSWVESQTRRGRHANASDYVCDLIRRDQERAAAIAELQAIVDDAIAGGESERTLEQILAEARADCDARDQNLA